MKKVFFLILLLVSIVVNAQKKQLQAEQQRPKLVVGIVVDQMKMDYLFRFYDDFSPNGFKRLLSSGYSFNNMHFNYMPTYTAPGHASIYTGATPSMHGIISNEWYNRNLGKEMYCTDDELVKTLGDGSEKEGKMSPKNLQATTITDELKLTTNFKGKVIGISIKDRGSILPAGHFANWAFWFSKTGSFISSSYYGEKLPEWVNTFNAEKNYMTYVNKGWNLLKPISTYNESLADENPYEANTNGKTSVFPYNLKEMYEKKDASILKATPFGNDILIDFTKKAIDKEQLGKDDVTDFLAISFSSTDYIGHYLGPRSIELQDTYLRLDQTIADFLVYLDTNVGKNNYLLFLTADHGGAENVTFMKDNKLNVKNIDSAEFKASLKQFSVDTFGENLVLNYSSYNMLFNREIIKNKNLELNKVKQSFKDFLMKQDFVKRVYTEEEILASTGTDYHLDCIAKGYDPTQSGDLVILEKPGIVMYGKTGTTHGSTYSYDTHVPCIFYGWHIPKGETSDYKVITQIAPTIAQKIKVTMPNGTESKVLLEVLDTK